MKWELSDKIATYVASTMFSTLDIWIFDMPKYTWPIVWMLHVIWLREIG